MGSHPQAVLLYDSMHSLHNAYIRLRPVYFEFAQGRRLPLFAVALLIRVYQRVYVRLTIAPASRGSAE